MSHVQASGTLSRQSKAAHVQALSHGVADEAGRADGGDDGQEHPELAGAFEHNDGEGHVGTGDSGEVPERERGEVMSGLVEVVVVAGVGGLAGWASSSSSSSRQHGIVVAVVY